LKEIPLDESSNEEEEINTKYQNLKNYTKVLKNHTKLYSETFSIKIRQQVEKTLDKEKVVSD